jgi:hypothetical protein
MNISKADQCRIRDYNLEQVNIQRKREEDYRKVVEKRNFDQIVADRVERNRRLDADKGQQVDVNC